MTSATDGYSPPPDFDYIECTSCQKRVVIRKGQTVILTPGGVGHVCDSTPPFILPEENRER